MKSIVVLFLTIVALSSSQISANNIRPRITSDKCAVPPIAKLVTPLNANIIPIIVKNASQKGVIESVYNSDFAFLEKLNNMSVEELFCILNDCTACYTQYVASISSTVWAASMTIKGCLALGPGAWTCIIAAVGVGGLGTIAHFIGHLHCLSNCDDQLEIEGPNSGFDPVNCPSCIIIYNQSVDKCYFFNATTGITTEHPCVILPIE